MEEFRQKYIEEVVELLTEMEQDLLDLEPGQVQEQILHKVFRVMHTIKGTSGMYGFNEIEAFTHRLESLYGKILEKEIQLDEEIITLTLKSGDYIKEYLTADNKSPEILTKIEAVFGELEQFSHVDENQQKEKKIAPENISNRIYTYVISFFPEKDLFVRGINSFSILEELSELGVVFLKYQTKDIPALQAIDHTVCYSGWEIILISTCTTDDIDDVFLFVPDEYKINRAYDEDLSLNQEFSDKTIDETKKEEIFQLAFLDSISTSDLSSNVLAESSPDKKLAISEAKVDENDTFSDIEKILKETKNSTIKVSSDKLDDLMKLVSQLFTTKAELQLLSDVHPIEELKNVTEKIEKLTNSLRENALNIRLVPINEMVGKFKRLVRDLSKKLDKEVDFVVEGGETEIDKSVLEQIAGPLMHMIRNAIDHGVETEAERLAKGKSKKGMVKFIAFYSGASVFVQVHDDGKGIDHDFIRNMAIEKGLIPPHTQLTRKESYDLIFIPGFSTSNTISKISGRGVGMDVVKKQITSIRGEIHVDSEIDLGTSITLKLPITLSILETLHVKIGEYNFLIPLHLVSSSYQVFEKELQALEEDNIEIEAQLIPFVNLAQHFKYDISGADEKKLVLVQYNEGKVGLVVDEIVGQYQAVFKPLGELYKFQTDMSGASILGDGNIALLLDVNAVVKNALNKV